MTLVWYAAYGSNLSRERFGYYLAGGTPPGATRPYPGCRDSSAPRDDRVMDLEGHIEFAGPSQRWSGGVAFFRRGEGRVRARAYLLTAEQFDDVVAQENHAPVGSITIGTASANMTLEVADGWYGLVLGCGVLDGIPVLTITGAKALPLSPPSDAYRHHIVAGLREAHSMTDDEINEYLDTVNA